VRPPPGGQLLAFASGDDEDHTEIWIHDLDRGDYYPVTNDRGTSFAPAWSADGKTSAPRGIVVVQNWVTEFLESP
jgi:Tol biopolymer transport system component